MSFFSLKPTLVQLEPTESPAPVAPVVQTSNRMGVRDVKREDLVLGN